MRAMFFCVVIFAVILWGYLGIHYGKAIGREIKRYFKRLFGAARRKNI